MNEGRMLAAWILLNVLALALIFICWRRPKIGRAILGLGFIAAAAFNAWKVLAEPQAFVRTFGPQALFAFYENFIYGPFAKGPALVVLPIAFALLVIGLLMFAPKAWLRLGLIGGTVFFLAITPLGQGSGFPMPLLGVAALWVVWQRSR